MNIQGNKVIVSKSQKETFEFLADLKNFEQLMPTSIQKFEVDGDSFIFGLKGAASSKLDFELVADITEIDMSSSEVQLHFNGKFNAMMAMMVKRPLNSFIVTLTDNLEKV
jgi:carbon monoxide dehydrogenase subunit G